MTHQQIIKLAAQAESEGNYRFADFLDRELVRVSFNPLSFFGKGVGTAGEKALIRGIEQEIARGAKPGLLSTVGTETKNALDSVGQGFNTGYISRAFAQEGDEATGAALRALETATPKSGNILQEAGGMLLGQGNKVITRTIQELADAETKITQIITRISQRGTKYVDQTAEILLFEQKNLLAKQKDLLAKLSKEYDDLRLLPPSQNNQRALLSKWKQMQAVESKITNTTAQMANMGTQPNNLAQLATRHLNGEKLAPAEMELLYKEILRAEPTAFAGKSKMRPSDVYDMLINKKITNVEMNKILGPVQKLGYLPSSKAGKWGTGLLAAGAGAAALYYGLPLFGAGIAGASAAGQAALNNMQGGNAGTAAQGGNVEGGSTSYGLGRDNASVGNSQYFANRAPSATVANKKTKWIKTSEL